VLSDAIFRDDDGRDVVVDLDIAPDSQPLVAISAELSDVLARLSRVDPSQDAASRPQTAGSQPGWRYRFHARRHSIADLTIDATGATLERSRSGARRSRTVTEVPAALYDDLARVTARALLRRVAPPRRALDAEMVALANLLASDSVETTSRPQARRLLVARLSASSTPRPLARAVMPSIAGFSRPEVAPLASAADIVVRLLALLRAAVEGERAALEEILTLSLEYHGDAAHFSSAVSVLLPPRLHPDLHRTHPPSRSRVTRLAFLRAARARAKALRFDGAGAWRIEDTP